jgi:hypothetical protein
MSTIAAPAGRPARRRVRSLRGALWLLALAMLAVQTLSLLHGVAHSARWSHASTDPTCPATALALRAAPKSLASQRPGSWLDGLFGGAAGHDCKAFDQASQGDLIGAVAPSLVVASLPEVPPCTSFARQHAAPAPGFLARGPPVAV